MNEEPPRPGTADPAATPAAGLLAGPLLWPRAVALVGASDDPGKVTSRPLRYLRAAGYAGRIYPVNPRHDTLAGQRCWPALDALPEVPDHVFVMTAAERAIESVRACGQLGVPVATVLASGFAEDGADGRRRQQQLSDAAGPTTRVVGPSSLGVINTRNGLLLTANAAFAEPVPGAGSLFVASQSGSLIGALMSRGQQRGVCFAGLVSTGGEADLSLGEICLSAVDDPGVRSYALFMETLQHSDTLAAFAGAAAARGKPVVVYKLGRSAQSAALSVSHTGALAGQDEEAGALFRACGFSRVDNLESLIETPALLARVPPGRPAARFRVGVLTSTGGGAALIVDQLGVRGISVQGASAPLRARLRRLGAPVAESVVMDLTLAGTRHEVVSHTLGELQRSGEFDLIVVVIGSSARFHPELAVRAVAGRAGGPVPVAAFALPDAPQALAALGQAGIPAFRTPEAAAEAIALAARRPARPARRLAVRPRPAGPGRLLSELDSYRLLGKLGISTTPHVELATADVLAGRIPGSLRYPVVAKVSSAEIAHKTDVGGVVLDLGGARELAGAAARISRAVARAGHRADRLLVCEQAPAGFDALAGYRVSPDIGPVVMVAAGGITAGLYRDQSLRLAPVDLPTAREMIDEVAGLRPVTGYRGLSGDADALARAIVALSSLAQADPAVREAELNPLRVFAPGRGVIALDALVTRAGPDP